MNAFTRAFGVEQGRIQPKGWSPPPEGDYAMVLGYDLAGRFEDLDIGDFIEARQTATFQPTTRILQATVYVRAPLVIPASVAWELSIWIDSIERVRRRIRAGHSHQLNLSANVSKLSGALPVWLRLGVVAP